MASDLSVANAARVSFARRKEQLDEADEGLIRFLMRDRHGCYDDATEVLTDSGWRAWADVTGGELFATRTIDGRLEYQPALRMVRKEYRGHMIGFKGMSVDLMVTPDHRVLASEMTTAIGRRRPRYLLRPAYSVLNRAHRHVTTARWFGEALEGFRLDGQWFAPEPLMRLVGFFIGDGNLGPSNHVVFNLRKPREIAFLRRIASETGLEVREWKNRHLAVPIGPQLRALFAECYAGRTKVIPSRLLGCSRRLLEALYEGLLYSDGSVSVRPGKADRHTYTTSSRRLADQVQELALKLGRSASVRPHRFVPGDGHLGTLPVWRITIYNPRNSQPALCRTRAEADNQMGVEFYDGAIHCVEVPSGTLYVRRNGYAVWSGNSPFEHNAFRFHVRTPIFVAREWFRHRIGCLTGDTEVTFVDVNGHAHLRKTIDELASMWERVERDGHALSSDQRAAVRTLAAEGRSQRSIARSLGVGRRSVRSCLAGADGYRDSKKHVRRMRLRVLDEASQAF